MAIGSKELASVELDTFEDERLVDELKKAKDKGQQLLEEKELPDYVSEKQGFRLVRRDKADVKLEHWAPPAPPKMKKTKAEASATARFAAAVVRFQKLWMTLFIVSGACVYANSRPVTETRISPTVSTT